MLDTLWFLAKLLFLAALDCSGLACFAIASLGLAVIVKSALWGD